MGLFNYKVANSTGKVTQLHIEADSERDAAIKLRERGYTVLKFLGEGSINQGAKERLRTILSRSRFDVNEFTGKLVPLLQSHVPLARALQIVYDGSENSAEKAVVANLRRGLQEGKRFSVLLREQGGKFPIIYSSLVEVGEESGELTKVMEEVYRFLTDSKELKDFLVTSSIYPLVLLAVTFLVILVIFVFFLPYFANIFIEMGRDLPAATKIMLGISRLIIDYCWLWIMGIGGGIWFLRHQWMKPTGREKVEGWMLKFPMVGGLIEAGQMSRFYRTLAILFQSHVHLLTSIRIAVGVVSNSVMQRSFNEMPAELRGGGKLSSAMKKSPYVNNETIQMVEVGEESGEVGNMLLKIAQAQESRLKLKIKRLLALFEPVVLVVLAIVILAVVLTVFLTILEMNEF